MHSSNAAEIRRQRFDRFVAGYHQDMYRYAAWLSRDPAAVRRYAEDPLCGAPFPNGFYLELTELLEATWKRRNEARIPLDLPLLVIAGTEDPVGDRTRGVSALIKRYRKLGIRDLTQRYYEGYRHELFHEQGREVVFDDVLAWLDPRCGGG